MPFLLESILNEISNTLLKDGVHRKIYSIGTPLHHYADVRPFEKENNQLTCIFLYLIPYSFGFPVIIPLPTWIILHTPFPTNSNLLKKTSIISVGNAHNVYVKNNKYLGRPLYSCTLGSLDTVFHWSNDKLHNLLKSPFYHFVESSFLKKVD